jgi:FkbM family methyltransferase
MYLEDIGLGFYVDVGTHDPLFLNNTYYFYKKGWSGICIEPDKGKCELIKLIRMRDQVVNAAASTVVGRQNYYVFSPDSLSTLSESEAEEFKKLGYKPIQTRIVDTKPLSQILSENAEGREIDLLSVDTEGFDLEVLKSNDWGKFRPKVIIVEVLQHRKQGNIRINKEFDGYLLPKNYVKGADTYLNAIYIDKAWAEKKKFNL